MHKRCIRAKRGAFVVMMIALLFFTMPAALAQQIGLPAPALLTPPAAFITSSPRPTLSWEAVPGAISYEIQISSTPEFIRTWQNAQVVSATQYTSDSLADGKYYWRVRSVLAGSAYGSWSVTREFTVNLGYPVRPEWMGENWLGMPHTGVPSGDPTGRVVINEICTACYWIDRTGVEFYNAGATPVNMTNWKMSVYAGLNTLSIVYYFPSFVLPAGGYVTVYEGAGTDTAAALYMGMNILYPYNAFNSRGAIALESTAPTGIDFVRFRSSTFGTSSVAPPKGAKWATPDPLSPQLEFSLGRDRYSFDSDRGADWTEQADSLGLANVSAFAAKPAAAPLQVSPAANAFVNSDGDTAVWNAAFRAETYNLQVSTVSNCSNPNIIDVTGISALSYDLALPAEGIYYWRVQARNPLGDSPWSACRRVTLDNTPPDTAPTLLAPAAGGTLASARPAMRWSAVAGATQYEVQLKVHAFEPETVGILRTNSYTPVSALVPGQYYWRVRALDAAGNAGPWSNSGAPATFLLTSPTSTAPILYQYDTNTPLLYWRGVSWANGYEVQVDNNSNFSSPEYVNSDIPRIYSDVFAGPLPTDGLYYWRVRARRDDGSWGPWSKPQTFYIRAQ